MSNIVSLGTKKKAFKSIRLAAEAKGISYMVFYMRLRAGMSPAKALNTPVRKYSKRV